MTALPDPMWLIGQPMPDLARQVHGAAVTAHVIRLIDDMVPDLDLTERDIAARLGTNVVALAKRCERGGRPDLARMFNQARRLP